MNDVSLLVVGKKCIEYWFTRTPTLYSFSKGKESIKIQTQGCLDSDHDCAQSSSNTVKARKMYSFFPIVVTQMWNSLFMAIDLLFLKKILTDVISFIMIRTYQFSSSITNKSL